MAGINNNLFPPIVDSFTPAFVVKMNSEGVAKGVCNVYFSLSLYNNISQIRHAQIIVQDQRNNMSLLKKGAYPSGIKITNILRDENRSTDQYYIQIYSDDIEGGFAINKYYKVQIRFSAIAYNGEPLDTWLGNNLRYFSEWSTVTLIRPISRPILTLKNFDVQEVSQLYFTYIDPRISGSISFEEDTDEEILKSYKVYLYDENNNILLQSQTFYPSPYTEINEIVYQLLYEFEEDVLYRLGIEITTKNLYTKLFKYPFYIKRNIEDDTFEATIETIADNKDGRILLNITTEKEVPQDVSTIIRRTSNRSEFKIWEDIKVFRSDEFIDNQISFYDYTVEAGTWYKYAALTEDVAGFRSGASESEQPIMIDTQDIFLTTAAQQLKVRFDPQISSFAYNISESRTQTIGSKYPFFRRNGNIKYRSFPLSGTITLFMDIRSNLMKASKQDVFRTQGAALYEEYSVENNVNNFTDVYYEREFRQKVMDFLYANNVKLFRSPTEGNILVKLMDISFSPNATLGRKIYTFSCTAYEIDECNAKNMIKYEVIDFGDSTKITYTEAQETGQTYTIDDRTLDPDEGIFDNISSGSQDDYFDLIKLISATKQASQDKYLARISQMRGVKIHFTSEPYLIRQGVEGENPVVITDDYDQTGTGAWDLWEEKPSVVLGHLIKVNGKPIIVKHGVYETSEDIIVTSLEIQKRDYKQHESTFTVDYNSTKVEEIDESKIAKSYSEFERIGQLNTFFNEDQELYSRIVEKYNKLYYPLVGSKETMELKNLSWVYIHTKPGVKVTINEHDLTVDETGYIEFKNANITSLILSPPNGIEEVTVPALINYKVNVKRTRY